MINKILIGSDHAGFELKEKLKIYLRSQNFELEDVGAFSSDSVDYPDFAHSLCKNITSDNRGILICGSGNGVNMVANKYNSVRAALCWNNEIASLARLHNNANVLSLPARFIDEDQARMIVDIFLSTKFEGGRHEARINKIREFEDEKN